MQPSFLYNLIVLIIPAIYQNWTPNNSNRSKNKSKVLELIALNYFQNKILIWKFQQIKKLWDTGILKFDRVWYHIYSRETFQQKYGEGVTTKGEEIIDKIS